MVSKATFGAQTEEYPALQSPQPFSVPDVLMLDSYTQTNEADRLSTTLITPKKSTANVQTDPFTSVPPTPPVRRPPTLTKRVSFSIQEDWAKQSPIWDSKIPIKEESLDKPTLDTPITFELKQTCRHGNDRRRCEECNSSVVHKKNKSSRFLDSFSNSRPSTETPQRQLPGSAPLDYPMKEEEKDSGQDSDIEVSPRISNTDLARIRNLAKAKLKQIRKPERSNRLISQSLERPRFTPNVIEEELEPEPFSEKTKPHKKRRPRLHDGIESLTLQDLPALKERTRPPESEDRSDDGKQNSVERTLKKVSKYQEEKRVSDVLRAKNYIRHCIDTPVDREGSYKHKSRRRDSGVASLPLIRENRRCESEATNKKHRGIADDVESRKCVSEVPSGKMRSFDVNYKAYIHALERIVDSNLSTLSQADRYYNKK